MASSNPFRKSLTQPKATQVQPPPTSFRHIETKDAEPPEKRKERKRVKKVRVLTPPPLSPDSPDWPETSPQPAAAAASPDHDDPFDGSATDESDRDSTPAPSRPSPVARQGPPPVNPFSRTLHDMNHDAGKEELDLQRREEGEVLKAAHSGVPALNVEAFKRLLLTGNSAVQQPAADPQTLASFNAEANKTLTTMDGASDQANTNHSSLHRGLNSASSPTQSKDKKHVPPPPPSSRHGKIIKSEQLKTTPSKTDRGSENKTTTPTNQDHSGGVDVAPTPEDGSSSNSSSTSTVAAAAVASSVKKLAPAPPPRRGHARTDTKTNTTVSTAAATLSRKSGEDEAQRRSSVDSTHRQDVSGSGAPSRPNTIPAPPPPRRPHAASSSSNISNRSVAPPLPRARGSSLVQRRRPSLDGSTSAAHGGVGGGGLRKDQDENTGVMPPAVPPPPPPPPPRHRRGSSSSNNIKLNNSSGSTLVRTRSGSKRVSVDGMPDASGGGDEGGGEIVSSQADVGKGADILADLDALRREVEALRGVEED